MIHGHTREAVLAEVRALIEGCGLRGVPHRVLFSRRRFKQRGARYGGAAPAPASSWAPVATSGEREAPCLT
jgi:hypothetical protein